MSAEHLKDFLSLDEKYQDFYPYMNPEISVEELVKIVDQFIEFMHTLIPDFDLDNPEHKELAILSLTAT